MIRAAHISDLPRITYVRTSVIENHLSVEQLAARGVTQASIAADMQSGKLGSWVAEESGVVVAFAMANKEMGNLFALFVQPGFEGRGHGSRLLATAEDWLRGNGVTKIVLDTGEKTRAVRFYLERGFVITSYDHGEAFMEKSLLQQ